jgi:4-alpha-glucanotransferase
MSSFHNSVNRSAGILCHPSSLFAPYGIGDFGSTAFNFVNFLKRSGQSFWQVLPLGPTGYGDSPYQCISAFAGNPLLIAPDGLIHDELISKEQVLQILEEKKTSDSQTIQWTISAKIDYEKVRKFKNAVFRIAFQNFNSHPEKFVKLKKQFLSFCEIQNYWLSDYVMFFSLKNHHNLKSWVDWHDKYRNFQEFSESLVLWKEDHSEELEMYKFIQWIFDKQWKELREYANSQGIQLIGDMPIFIAHDSADAWANPHLFTIANDFSLTYKAGVPPDYFSETGQLWGNPLYNWKVHEKSHFNWFLQRFQRLVELFDWIRVDHFRGFESYWEIPGNALNAIKGKWVKSPGKELFAEIRKSLGSLPIIAEDLGIITPEVEELRDYFRFPGMKVLQFAFTGEPDNPHLPHNIKVNSVVYSGTHDNDTSLGWWNNGATKLEKKYLLDYLNVDGLNFNSDFIKALYQTVAKLAIIPIQDLLGVGSEARMNTPGVGAGNWQYRIQPGDLSKKRSKWLSEICKLYGR